MLCHVTRPDSVVMEVEVDAKANGEDCLNKVGCGGIHITLCYCDSFFNGHCRGQAGQQSSGCPVKLQNIYSPQLKRLRLCVTQIFR